MATMYILYSKSRDRYYVGSTTDLNRRIYEHNIGHTRSTISGRPWVVVFQSEFMSLLDARKKEKKLKKWKNRKILEKIINTGKLLW